MIQRDLGKKELTLTLTQPSPSSKEVRPGTNAEAIEEFPLWLGLLSTRP